jgi:hypothetical protein
MADGIRHQHPDFVIELMPDRLRRLGEELPAEVPERPRSCYSDLPCESCVPIAVLLSIAVFAWAQGPRRVALGDWPESSGPSRAAMSYGRAEVVMYGDFQYDDQNTGVEPRCVSLDGRT